MSIAIVSNNSNSSSANAFVTLDAFHVQSAMLTPAELGTGKGSKVTAMAATSECVWEGESDSAAPVHP